MVDTKDELSIQAVKGDDVQLDPQQNMDPVPSMIEGVHGPSTVVHGLLHLQKTSCRICSALSAGHSRDEDIAVEDVPALILHVNNGIAVLLALWLKPLFSFRLPLPMKDANVIRNCSLTIASHQVAMLGKTLSSKPPELAIMNGDPRNHTVEKFVDHLYAVRDWLDEQIDSYVGENDHQAVHAVHPQIEESRELIERFVDVSRVLQCERTRVERLLEPKFSVYSKVMLILCSVACVYDLRSDWLVAFEHFTRRRYWEGAFSLLFLHSIAHYIASSALPRSSRRLAYTLLPILPVVNNWKLYELGLSMASKGNPSRIEDRKAYKQLQMENTNWLCMVAGSKNVLQFLLQSQTLLRLYPDMASDDTMDEWLAVLTNEPFLIRSIVSNLVLLCWSSVTCIRNRTPEKTYGVRGALSDVATLIYTACLGLTRIICYTLLIWQCPWYIILAGIILNGVCTGMTHYYTTKNHLRPANSSEQVTNCQPAESDCTSESSTATDKKAIRIVCKRFIVHNWREPFCNILSYSILIGLYALYAPQILAPILITAAILTGIWLTLFTVNMKVDFM